MNKNQSQLLDTALSLAGSGYSVFPLTVTWDEERNRKKLMFAFPKTEGWDVESTTDADKIRSWFTSPRKGMKGLAIDTGKSGVVAIDFDVNDRVDGLVEWEKLPEQQPTPMTVRTGSGGLHRLYRDPSGLIRNSANEVAPGIDIRGAGGFVVTAPTKVWGTDRTYGFEAGITPVDELPALTVGMVDIITNRQGTANPRFDPAIHGSYQVSRSQGAEVVSDRLKRLESPGGYRAAIFGYAVGVAQYEGAIAQQNDATVDEDTLTAYIFDQILSVVPWDTLDDDDVHWITDGVTKGLANPWEIVDDEDVLPDIDPDTPIEDILQRAARRMRGHPRGQHGLAAPVVVDGLAGRYLHVQGLGWHEWVGDRWSSEPRIPVLSAVQQMTIRHKAEAQQMLKAAKNNDEFKSFIEELATLKESNQGEPSAREEHLEKLIDRVDQWTKSWEYYDSWWTALSNGNDLREVMKFVERDPGQIFILASDLDQDANLINCSNGTVDLRTGELHRHNPGDFITKSTHVPYDAQATHGLWDKAREAFAPGIEDWLQLRVGEGTYGYPSHDDSMLFCFGQGSNGKSTLTDAILNALGDYAVFLHDKALLGQSNDHGTEQMVLRGARWGVLEELPEAQVLRPAMIKKLIGTSKITARLMRQDNVTFNVTHSLIVNSNHRPTVLENDRGTWRRLVAVPWPWTFKFASEAIEDESERRADPAIKFGLSRNLDVQKAALAWIVAGARRFHENDRSCGSIPEAVQAETNSWRSDSDTFGTFFDQELIPDPTCCVPTRELLESYNDWLLDLGKKTVSDAHVGSRLGTIKSCRRVVKKMVKRNTKALTISSRSVITALPAQVTAWVGLRWLTDNEKASQGL